MRARSSSSRASRVSARTPRTSRRWAAAARTPPRWRLPRRSTPTSARSTPTWTASSPPTRGSSRTPGAWRPSPTRRCSSSPRPGRRGSCSAASRTPAARARVRRAGGCARREGIPVHVRSSYSQLPGTIVTGSMEDLPVEQAIITGVAHDRSEGKITVYGVPDRPGEAAQIFRVLADAEINIDMIVQNVSAEASKLADISFTLPKSDGPAAIAALERVQHTVGYTDVSFDQHIGKVSLVGAGMRSHPGVSAKFFGALADAGVNLELISTSEIRISVVCRDTDVDIAVRAVHDAFDLGSDVEAVVYGGTGR